MRVIHRKELTPAEFQGLTSINSGAIDQRFPANFDHISERYFCFTFYEERLYWSDFTPKCTIDACLVISILNEVVNLTRISSKGHYISQRCLNQNLLLIHWPIERDHW